MLLYSNAEPYRYQLRAYIYQGRDLLSGDSSGLSGIRSNRFSCVTSIKSVLSSLVVCYTSCHSCVNIRNTVPK